MSDDDSGDQPMHRSVAIQTDDFDVGAELSVMRARTAGNAGAIASFVGLVRDVSPGPGALTLEHYPGMTERSLEEVVDRAEARWPLLDVSVIHRVGRLLPAEQIVLVMVASAHRAAAFDACEFLMDYLKTDAVLWKHQSVDGGDSDYWVQSTGTDRERRSRWDDG